jgi:anti-anti-sigma factor
VTVPTEARPMNTTTYLTVLAEDDSQRSVLRLLGELDVSNRESLRHAVSGALERHRPVLVIDLSELTFADCAGLSVLVWAHRTLEERGHTLFVTGTQPIVQRILHLTGADSYLHLSEPGACTLLSQGADK